MWGRERLSRAHLHLVVFHSIHQLYQMALGSSDLEPPGMLFAQLEPVPMDLALGEIPMGQTVLDILRVLVDLVEKLLVLVLAPQTGEATTPVVVEGASAQRDCLLVLFFAVVH